MYDCTTTNMNTTPKMKLATASLLAAWTLISVPVKSPETARTSPDETRTPSITRDVLQASLLESDRGRGTSANASRKRPHANSRQFNAFPEMQASLISCSERGLPQDPSLFRRPT